MIDYFENHWCGALPVSKSLWLGSTIAWLASMPIYILCLWLWATANHLAPIDFFEGLLQGQVAQQPFYLWFLNELSADAFFVWWAVGVWRSCDRHEIDAAGKRKTYWIARSFVFLSAFAVIYSVLSDVVDYIRPHAS